jgi:hypothetical protein
VRRVSWRRKPKYQSASRTFTGSCPIREHTGDGAYVGRCEFATYDGVCPRHGLLSQYPDNDDRAVDPQSRVFVEGDSK